MIQLQQKSFHWLQNFDGTFDGAFQQGNKTPTLLWNLSGLASQTGGRTGVGLSFNARSLLVGDGSGTAVISMIAVSGNGITGWTAAGSGSTCTNPGSTSGSGSFFLRATFLGTTVDSAPITWSIIPSGKVKWNPGPYGASFTLLDPGSTLTGGLVSEMNTALGNLGTTPQDWIIGWRAFVHWAHLDIGPMSFTASVGGATSGTLTAAPGRGDGVYFMRFADGSYRDVTVTSAACTWSGAIGAGSITSADVYWFSVIQATVDRCATFYHKPKQYGLVVVPMSFAGGTRGGDTSVIPAYITKNSIYGPSPDGSSFGWWGPAVGQTIGLYTAATYRPAVANRYAMLGEALGAKFNSNPNFEFVMDQEDSAVVQGALAHNSWPAGTGNQNDGTYSDTAYVAQMKTYLSRWVAAFPNTSVIAENTFLQTAAPAQDFEVWMIQNRIACGSADTTGQSFYNTPVNGVLPHLDNWGLSAYAGQKNANNTGPNTYTDFRGQAACMLDVEGPDIGSGSKTPLNNQPLDIVNAINQTYFCSHAFFNWVASGTGGLTWANNISPVLRDNPFVHTGYPANYP